MLMLLLFVDVAVAAVAVVVDGGDVAVDVGDDVAIV